MREITASEASRNFSTLLDSVEKGETIVVTRGGRRIAAIAPTMSTNGRGVNDVIARWRGAAAIDDALVDAIDTARTAASPDNDANPWTD